MLRSTLGSVFVSTLVLVACADAASTEGSPGTASLTSLSPEAAGANCKSGGTKITSGLDLDANGTLDPAEVTSTQYVCHGASGNDGANGENGTGGGSGSLVNVESEPKGANSANGGLRVQTGSDKDGNGKLDDAEVTGTQYVCNGTNGTNGSGGTKPLTAYVYTESSSKVSSQASSVTVQQLTITATGPGKVVAVLNTDVFCASPAENMGYDCNPNGVTAGYFTLTTNATAAADSGNYEYFFLSPNSSENMARTMVFDAAAAGDLTVYVRARTNSAGAYAFFRSSLTLLFIPN